MKKYIVYIGLLAIGLLLGKFVFQNTEQATVETHDHTTETAAQHWTCSMHPQIDMPEAGQCPICGMDLILKDSNADEALNENSFKMTKNAMALANVQTVVIGEETENAKAKKLGVLRLSGTIKANDKASAMQTAHFGGRLERLYYKTEGEVVGKGALLASVYSPELVTAQNELLEAMKVKELQPELYKAVRNKLKNWKISEKQIEQLERTQKVQTNFKMYANVSGTIDKIFAQEGDHVKEGTPLFMISNLSTVWAVFDVYEQDISNIKIGQELAIKTNAYPNEVIHAKINFIDPILNAKNRSIAVRATLQNRKNKLKPGMLIFSTVNVHSNKKENTSVQVPKTAVLWTGKRSVVYVKTSEGVFELREVVLGADLGEVYQVVSGLDLGEEIVVNGTFTVDAVAQLQGKPSMMEQGLLKQEVQTEITPKNYDKINVNPKFKKQLQVVFDEYFKLKDAFVATDSMKAKEKAKNMLAALQQVEMKNLKKPEAHQVWMPAKKQLQLSLQKVMKENNIEKQRATFINISSEIQKLSSIFGTNKTIFVQFCPMANDNGGANWLSTQEKIMNPYFGDKMLHCGSVKATIK